MKISFLSSQRDSLFQPDGNASGKRAKRKCFRDKIPIRANHLLRTQKNFFIIIVLVSARLRKKLSLRCWGFRRLNKTSEAQMNLYKARYSLPGFLIDKVNAEQLIQTNILLYRISGILILNLMGIKDWKLNTEII